MRTFAAPGRKRASVAAEPLSPTARVPRRVEEVARSPGRPLPPPVAAAMGARLGHDFSDVRVHTDAGAAASAEAIGADAYAVGHDVAFAAGRFAPSTETGAELLAHELVHVARNGGAPASVVRRQLRRQIREKPPLPGEHPEIAGIPSPRLRSLHRMIRISPNHYRRYLIEAAATETIARERARLGEPGGATRLDIPPTISPEGGPPPLMSYLGDPAPIALNLLTDDPSLMAELEALDEDVAARYIDLLGNQLMEVARDLLTADPAFRREVQEAARRRMREMERRRERRRLAPEVAPEGGGSMG